MLDTYIKNRGMTKTIIHNNNRNTVNETKWDTDYDGAVANVSLDLSNNGKNQHLNFKLTNDDLANMLSIPSVRQPIHKRLKMDFKKPKSFEKIFLEIEPESEFDSEFDSDLEDLTGMEDLSSVEDMFSKNEPKDIPVQQLLTHISSPKSNEEFIMPFKNYSLQDERPVIKIIHKQPSRKRSSSSKRSNKSNKSNKSHKRSSSKRSHRSRKNSHHNYPATRKSPSRKFLF